MIKVVNIVSLIIAPIMVQYQQITLVSGIVIILLLALLWWAIVRSKREAVAISDTSPVMAPASD
jgi:predicted ABC-type exoprotein transport system permease subunit